MEMLAESVQVLVIDDLVALWVDVAMFAVAFLSALCALFAYRHQRNRSKKDAACKLAAQYADDILEKYGFVGNVYYNTGLDEYVKHTINFNDIFNFDNAELDALLKGKVEREQFDKKMADIDPEKILLCRILRSHSQADRDRISEDYVKVDEEGSPTLYNASLLLKDFFQEQVELLNQLEHFSMSCRYGLSDEKILYQSLHKTFLAMVWMLYPAISSRNISEEDKTYTNVIWLFLKWRKRLVRIKAKAERKKRYHERRAARAMVKVASEQAKAEKVKAEVYSGKRV